MNMMTSLEAFVPCGMTPGLQFRMQIENLIDCLIQVLDRIDEADGLELDGDEFDGSLAEDDFHNAGTGFDGPGCPLSDPDCAVDDAACDEVDGEREPECFLVPVYGSDQSQPLPFDPYADRRIMRPHTARVRADLRTRQFKRAA